MSLNSSQSMTRVSRSMSRARSAAEILVATFPSQPLSRCGNGRSELLHGSKRAVDAAADVARSRRGGLPSRIRSTVNRAGVAPSLPSNQRGGNRVVAMAAHPLASNVMSDQWCPSRSVCYAGSEPRSAPARKSIAFMRLPG